MHETADELEFKQYDINILYSLPISKPKLDAIRNETKEDETLKQLRSTVESGWPTNKREAPASGSENLLELSRRNLPPRWIAIQRGKSHHSDFNARRYAADHS